MAAGLRATRRGVRPRLQSRRLTAATTTEGIFLDSFSGSGGVARAVRLEGFKAVEWDRKFGEAFDLTKKKHVRRIKQMIRDGEVIGACLAPPCASFSIARDRTLMIRDKSHPWGLPDLPAHEQLKVSEGNACLHATFQVIRCLNRFRVP